MNESPRERILAPMREIVPIIEQTLSCGGKFRLITAGTSMLPLLRNRTDTVILCKPATLSRYDIILYRRSHGHYVLHRIMKCESDGTFTLCGDNQLIYERGIKRDDVIAVVSQIERNGKTIDLSASVCYRIYVFFWCRCRAVRFLAFKLRAVGSKINKVLRKIKGESQ